MDGYNLNNANFPEEDNANANDENGNAAEAIFLGANQQSFPQGHFWEGFVAPPSSELTSQRYQENTVDEPSKMNPQSFLNPQMGSPLQSNQFQYINNLSSYGGGAVPGQTVANHSEDISALLEQQQQRQAMAALERQNQVIGMDTTNMNGGSNSIDYQFIGAPNASQNFGGLTGPLNIPTNLFNTANLPGQHNLSTNPLSGSVTMQNALYLNHANTNQVGSRTQESLQSQVGFNNTIQNSMQQSLQGPTDTSLVGMGLQLPPETKRKGRGRSSTFPLKLHQMLMDLEKEEGGASIASFLPHGKSFSIHKPKAFAEKIMPKYFRMGSYSSFQRQLNLYDFQRISEGPEKGAYWHEDFQKNQPVLSTNMKRSKVKGMTRAKQEERLKNYERTKKMM